MAKKGTTPVQQKNCVLRLQYFWAHCSKFVSDLYRRRFAIHQEITEIAFSWRRLYVRSSSDVTSSLDESFRSLTSSLEKVRSNWKGGLGDSGGHGLYF